MSGLFSRLSSKKKADKNAKISQPGPSNGQVYVGTPSSSSVSSDPSLRSILKKTKSFDRYQLEGIKYDESSSDEDEEAIRMFMKARERRSRSRNARSHRSRSRARDSSSSDLSSPGKEAKGWQNQLVELEYENKKLRHSLKQSEAKCTYTTNAKKQIEKAFLREVTELRDEKNELRKETQMMSQKIYELEGEVAYLKQKLRIAHQDDKRSIISSNVDSGVENLDECLKDCLLVPMDTI